MILPSVTTTACQSGRHLYPYKTDTNTRSIARLDTAEIRALRPPETHTVEKSGTLILNQGTYTLPQNDLPGLIQLHLNENLFASCQTAVDKEQMTTLFTTYLENLHRYPTNGVQHLQTAIAAHWRIGPEQVVVGNGSSALLRNLFFYLLGKNERLLLPNPGWSFYKATAALVGAKIETFPLVEAEDQFVYDKEVIAAKIETCRPKVVLLCSPNNPTGNVLPLADLLWLVYTYPQVNFILDEAYYGFQPAYSTAQERALLDNITHQNLFVVRTFSKFYGLANLRLGFLICHETDAQNLQKIAPVFGLPSFDQALAVGRLTDSHYQQQIRQEYAVVNAAVYEAFQQIPGFTPYQTHANFILVRHDDRWWELDKTLLGFGYKIKRETIKGERNYLRITYADIATMNQLITLIQQLAAATAA